MTQSGGQSAGIQLQVGLDLAYFRSQMQKVSNIASSEFTGRLDVRFNKTTLDAELNNLQRAIKRRVYRVEIGGNIDSLPDKIRALRQQLASLEDTTVDVGVGVVKSLSRRDAQKVKTDLRQSILGEDKKILVPVSIKPSITKTDVRDFTNAVKSKLAGITVSIKADLEAASVRGGAKSRAEIDSDVLRGLEAISEIGAARMSGGGGVTEAARREQLKQRLSTGEFDIGQLRGLSEQLGVKGAGRFRNAQNLIEKIVAEASVEMIKKYLDPQAVMRNPSRSALQTTLDTFARGLFKMLGMDPAAMLQQARQKRLPSSINWQATAPRQTTSLGPSSSGRLLTGTPAMRTLPGSAYGERKRLVGDILSPSLKEALRGAANAFADAVRTELNNAVRSVQVRDLGRAMQSALSPQRIAGLLPAGVGRTASTYSTGAIGGESREQIIARRTREAYMRSAQREMDVMGGGAGRPASPYSYAYRGARPLSAMVPYAAGGAIVPAGGGGAPPRPPTGVRAGGLPPRGSLGGGGLGGFGRALGGINLPGTGLIREIGSEFAMATKQVLLFGTAYKALAFATSFPAQVGQAVAALQSFNNTLKAISPTASEAGASNQFILDIVDRYNVPLQSARDGFTKLYASMAPAGFKGDEIRALFTGVSQAAATFGMSADKVDRVNYAFAQMASKGQVMSEELKGQLGDVLPGAMGIFAEAAGFKGPDAIEKFSKALEDGAYKGEAMRGLLKNVTVVLTKEFGPGAEGAARTFQGVMNRMQNSTQLLYEAFEPVAVGFLNSVVVPLTSGIKTVTDGFNAFFAGTQAKTTGGFAFAQELEKLKPAFDGIRANVAALLPALQSLVGILLDAGKVFLQIAGNSFVGYLARVYLNVLALTTAIQLLNLRALLPMIASFVRSAYALVAFTVQCARAGQAAQVMGLMVRTAGITLRAFFATTGVGLVVVGIGILIERIMSMNQALADTKAKAIGAADAIRSMSQTEARQASQQYDRQAQSLKRLTREMEEGKVKGKAWIEVTKDQAEALKSAGITVSDVRGSLQVQPTRVAGAYQKIEGLAAEARFRVESLDYQDRQTEPQASIATIPLAPGKEEKTNLESYYSLQEQLAKVQTQGEIDRIQDAFDHRFNLLNAYYDLEDARSNSFQKATIAFQKELLSIEQERQQAAVKARAEVLKAQGSVAGGVGKVPSAPVLPPPTGRGGAFDTGMRTGPSGAIGGSAPYHQDIMFGSTVSMKERVQLMDQLAQGYEKMGRVIEFSNAGVANDRYRSSMSYEAKSSLISRAQAAHANRPGGSGRAAMDFYAPLASSNRFGRSVEGQAMLAPSVEGASYSYGGGGRAGRTMTASRNGAMVYEQLHGSMAVPLQAGAPRPVKGSERREQVAEATAAIAVRRENTLAVNSEELALKKVAIAYEKYLASVAPVAEQELQNSLLEKRVQLMNSGVTGEFLETQMKIFEAQEEARISGTMLDKANKEQVEGYRRLQERLPKYITSLENAAVAQQDLNFATAKFELAKRKSMARALTPEAELRAELVQKYPGNLAMQEQELSETKLVQGMEKTKESLQNIASSIGDAFGSAFKGIVTGASSVQESLAGLFQSIADSFADMVAKMIAEWLKAQLIQGLQGLLGAVTPNLGTALGAGASSFNPGAFGGPALSGGAAFGAGGVPDFSSAFGAGGPSVGTAFSGVKLFANGGIVTGPTLGLVGEGRYNEAVIPLPDGKSVPVDLGGAMGGQITSNIVVNVSSDGKTSSSGAGSDSAGLGRKLEGAVKQVLVDELRPGGLLSGRR